MLTYIVVSILFILTIIFRWRYSKFLELSKVLKHDLPTLPILGVSHMFFGDEEDRMKALLTLSKEALKKDGIIYVRLAYAPFIVVADPKLADVLSKTSLEKHDIMRRALKVLMGNSSLIAPVPIWRPRRKILIPTFSPKNFKQFMNIFVEQSKELVKQLKEAIGKPISMFESVVKYTMASVCQTVLGVQLGDQLNSEPFTFALSEFTRLIGERTLKPWLHNDFIYQFHPSNKILMKNKKYLKEFTSQIIKLQRQRVQKDKNEKIDSSQRFKSFLELLVESSGAERGYTDRELFEETMTLIMAGTDTSGVGSSFVALMLARLPDVQEAIYKELTQVLGNETLTSEYLPSLKYLNAAIRETLRLYTPVPLVVRQADQDVTLPSGVVVPKGCGIAIAQWAINRNPRYWGADAEEFRPERFLNGSLKHAGQFASFSLGPRNCPGYQYAMSSMMTLFATMLRHYRIVPAPGTKDEAIRLKYGVMMKDVNNFMVQLEPRK